MKEKSRIRAFNSAKRKVSTVLNNPERANRLLDAATRISLSTKNLSPLQGLGGKILALVRMVRSFLQKEYRDIPWQTLAAVTAALIYFVSPLDALADFIPLLGFADDAAILSAVLTSINHDLERFLSWEQSRCMQVETASHEAIDSTLSGSRE